MKTIILVDVDQLKGKTIRIENEGTNYYFVRSMQNILMDLDQNSNERWFIMIELGLDGLASRHETILELTDYFVGRDDFLGISRSSLWTSTEKIRSRW